MKFYPEAADGLYKVFLGQALSALSLLMAGTGVGLIMSLGGLLLYLLGLRQAKASDRGYWQALILAVSALGLNFLNSLINQVNQPVASVISVCLPVLNLVTLVLVCRTTVRLAAGMGLDRLVKMGKISVVVDCVGVGLATVLSVVLMAVPLEQEQSMQLANATLLAVMLGALPYLLFLFRASRQLGREPYEPLPVSQEKSYEEYDGYDDAYDDEYDEYDEYDEEYDEEDETQEGGARPTEGSGE